MLNKQINWEAIHQHLETTKKIFDDTMTYTAEQTTQILRQRANKLSLEPPVTDHQQNKVKILDFILGDERYGIESLYVNRVCKVKNIMSLPGVPTFIEGL